MNKKLNIITLLGLLVFLPSIPMSAMEIIERKAEVSKAGTINMAEIRIEYLQENSTAENRDLYIHRNEKAIGNGSQYYIYLEGGTETIRLTTSGIFFGISSINFTDGSILSNGSGSSGIISLATQTTNLLDLATQTTNRLNAGTSLSPVSLGTQAVGILDAGSRLSSISLATQTVGYTALANTSGSIAATLGFTPIGTITPITSGSITVALGYTPVSNTLGSITSALGYTPIETITSGSVTLALGYTPIANTSGSITGILGYTPLETITSGSITNALNYTPLGNTRGSITTVLMLISIATETTGITDAGTRLSPISLATQTVGTLNAGTSLSPISLGTQTVGGLNISEGTITTLTGNSGTLTGGFRAGTFYGDGSQLSGITGGESGSWTSINGNLYPKNIADKVGIGTTTPDTILRVIGTITATDYLGNGSQLTGIANLPINLATQTTGKIGLGTQTNGLLDLATQTTNTLNLTTQVSGKLSLGTQTNNLIDLATQTTNTLNLTTQTNSKIGLGTQTNGSIGLATQTTGVLNAGTNLSPISLGTQTVGSLTSSIVLSPISLATQTVGLLNAGANLSPVSLSTQTVSLLSFATQTTGKVSLGTQTNGLLGLSTQTVGILNAGENLSPISLGTQAVGILSSGNNLSPVSLSTQTTGVSISSPVSGHFFKYDGTNWINATSTGASVAWGDITGTITDQTDLNVKLNTISLATQTVNLLNPGTQTNPIVIFTATHTVQIASGSNAQIQQIVGTTANATIQRGSETAINLFCMPELVLTYIGTHTNNSIGKCFDNSSATTRLGAVSGTAGCIFTGTLTARPTNGVLGVTDALRIEALIQITNRNLGYATNTSNKAFGMYLGNQSLGTLTLNNPFTNWFVFNTKIRNAGSTSFQVYNPFNVSTGSNTTIGGAGGYPIPAILTLGTLSVNTAASQTVRLFAVMLGSNTANLLWCNVYRERY